MSNKATSYGDNVLIEETEGKVVITINTKKTFGQSSSGKSLIVASTRGNVRLDCGAFLGVNCYRK